MLVLSTEQEKGKKGEERTFKSQTELQSNTGDSTKLGSRREGVTKSNEQKVKKIKTAK